MGGDVFGALRDLLGATTTIVAATGILNLWMHSAAEVGQGLADLDAEHADRTLLGIGVSHSLLIDQTHPGEYAKPLAVTRNYLDELDATSPAVPIGRRVLAALGPKMLELSPRPRRRCPSVPRDARAHRRPPGKRSATVPCCCRSSTSCSRPTRPRPGQSHARD